MARFVWVLLLSLSAVPAWSAEVYRSVDAQGNVVYSDRPEGTDAESLFIATRQPTPPPPATPAAAPEPTGEAEDEPRRERREPTAEEREADRSRNCAIARERVESYSMARRLYREAPDGGREYLSDQEITEARAQATADVQEWCD